MHRFVLEDREDRFGAVEQRMARLLDVGVEERVNHLTVCLVCKLLDHVARGPFPT
jgi:hypothetical protein